MSSGPPSAPAGTRPPDQARAFCERWGFERSPTDPLDLQLLFKDVRESLE
jgi:hypothetical protein